MLAHMREMSVTEQRYQVVLAVLADGRAVMEVASQWGVSRRTVHRWLARYEADVLEGLPDRSHRPERCPHQMPAEIEVRVLELRRRTEAAVAVVSFVAGTVLLSKAFAPVGEPADDATASPTGGVHGVC